MARNRSNPHPTPGLTIGDFMTLSSSKFAAKAKRLRANRGGRTKQNAFEYTGYGPLNNPVDEYLALEGYNARVLWPKYTPGGGINSGDADYIPRRVGGSLFTRDINLLRNGRTRETGENDHKVEALEGNERLRIRDELYRLKKSGRSDDDLKAMLGLSSLAFFRLMSTKGSALKNGGGGDYQGMRVTQARFGGTCKMSGMPYERGEEIVKVPEMGWCSLSAVKAQSARENRGNRGRRNRF